MKLCKRVIAVLGILVFCAASLWAESELNKYFVDFGIKSIGIYTEGYEDTRVKDFEKAYNKAYASQDVGMFRYTLCRYVGVTPKLTTPRYPISGVSSQTQIDTFLGNELSSYLEALHWDNTIIKDFDGGNLSKLLAHAAEKNIDAALIVRYYPIEYFVPFSGFRRIERYSTITLSAAVGGLNKGLGLIPAMELYDTETGVRLWYSAYFTGTVDRKKKLRSQVYQRNAANLFISGDDPEKEAASVMVQSVMDAGSFPKASASGNRNEDIVQSQRPGISKIFWSDDPIYDLYMTLVGLRYNYEYIGNFEIWYYDKEYNDGYDYGTEYDPVSVGSVPNAMIHMLGWPVFTIATGNISLEPSQYVGIMQPTSSTIKYTDYVDDDNNPYTEPQPVEKSVDMNVWALKLGFDLSFKYFFRLQDAFSAYIGGKGLIEMWQVFHNSGQDESYGGKFVENVPALMRYDDSWLINASILAGLKWETGSPVELFGEFTPVGPGGTPMISAGIIWNALTVGWVSPHSKNVKPLMRW